MYHEETYYTCLESLSRRFVNTKRSCSFTAETLEQYDAWKRRTRETLRELTGISRMETCDLAPRLLGTEELPGESFRRHKLLIQTEEGVFMPFYLLEPKEKAGPLPAMICPHGHVTSGKLSTGGRTDIPEVKEITDRQHYEYGVEFARRGLMVFCPDARGFGERRELCRQGDTPDKYMDCCCKEINQMAIPLGLTVTGMWTWDLMRLIDYIETRPDCDASRIGVGGLSGGGLQTLWVSALDDRVSAAAVSGYFYGYHDALLVLNENCSCNYVPHLWEAVDIGDIGALIAPRALIVETGDQDPLNGARGVQNTDEPFETVKKAYRLFGKEENCFHSVCSGEHRWYGYDSYDFITRHLRAGE